MDDRDQVTRLKCGGFIFAMRVNHMMCDLVGMVQFMKAMAELAKGAEAPPVLPVWRRELLKARDPPLVTCEHRGHYDLPDPKGTILPFFGKTHRSFFFYPSEISSLRLRVPPRLQNCSTFEILAACLWRCRTAALRLEPEDNVRLLFTVDIRARLTPPLPVGYYGNAFASTTVDISAGELCRKPLEFALDLVRKAKANVTEEFVRSFVDNIALVGEELPIPDIRIFTVSDGTRGGSEGLDFGWGKPKYGGPARGFASFFVPTRNMGGEVGIIVPMGLPVAAMERFEEELKAILRKEDNKSKLVRSAM